MTVKHDPIETFLTMLRDSSHETLEALGRTQAKVNPNKYRDAWGASFQSVYNQPAWPIYHEHLSEAFAILKVKGFDPSKHTNAWDAIGNTIRGIISYGMIDAHHTVRLLKSWLKHYPDPTKDKEGTP